MNKEELKVKLKKYDYKFTDQFDVVTVKLGSLEVKVDFSEIEKVIISDRLRGYNVLTGVWSMSIKGSIIFNSILSFLYLMFYFYLSYNLDKPFFNFLTLFFFILGVGWWILWTIYFLFKLEGFKTLIMSWDK